MNDANKLKVAFFLPSLEPGGTEKNVVHLVKVIDKNRYQVSLVLGKKEGDFISQLNKDIEIINLGASNSVALFFSLIIYFRKTKPDIFVSAFTRINIISILAKLFSGVGKKVKIIATEHAIFSLLGDIAKTRPRKLFVILFLKTLSRLTYPFTDSIVCVSQKMAEDFIKNVGCKEKVSVIYNPVLGGELISLSNEGDFEPEVSGLAVPMILAVGRLVDCKNYPGLFKAFALVLKSKPAHLVILGKGPEEKLLKKMVEDMNLSKNITFMGFKQNPYKYMKKASVFVLASLQEGFGNVIIESMACGCPVIATDCPTGPGEIIENEKNGILVPVQDEKSLADSILRVLQDQDLAKRLSLAGQDRAKDFTVKKSVQEYQELFEKIYE